MEPLRIHLFGGFLLERDGTTLPPIASRAGRSLFAYLAMHRGRPLQRDHLAGSFWPELPEGRARRRLSHTLWQIQDVVSVGSASHLTVTPDTLAFDTDTPYWLDVEEFDRIYQSLELPRRHTRLGRSGDAVALRTCAELYRGDFLAGFFDDWAVVEQDIYRERYLVVLSRLVEATKGQGAYDEALAYARRLTHHDPLREEAHQEVMRLCFLLGRTSEAVQQFERCRSVLAEELGAEPSRPTLELYRKILRQRRVAGPPPEEERAVLLGPRSEVPFVGRDEERRSLVDHLERVLAGRGGVVLVEGEPGVGKTRLALEGADDARWRGFEVSWGTCRPGTLRPFAPLSEVLESLSPLRVEQLSEQVSPVWLKEAMRLAPRLAQQVLEGPVSAPLRPDEESTRMQEALVRTLGALGSIAPHLVVVDDVHWADRDTLGVLTQLGARLAGTRILLLLLFRSEEGRGEPEVWDVLRDLDRVAGLGRVVLAPLSVFELGDMVKRLLGLGRVDPAVASRLHRRTGGNVLFTLETLLALRDQGLLESGLDPSSVLDLAGKALPVAHRVRSVIDARTSLLDQRAVAVFEACAVCGDASDLSVLAAGAALPRSEVLDAVDDLLHRRLIREEGEGRYGIPHDQIRQVVYERLEEPRRVEVHRRVAEALAVAAPEDVEALGHHFREGRVPRRAAEYLEQAGRRAARLHAFETAAQHLEGARRAAAEAGWGARRRYDLLSALEAVLSVLGRREEQAQVIEEMGALGRRDAADEGDLERRKAWLLSHLGRFAEAEEHARRSAEVERRRGDRAGIAASLVALGTCLRWSGRPLDAIPHLEAALQAAAHDRAGSADAHTELGSTLVEVQRAGEALPHLEAAGTLYRELADPRGEAEVLGIEARAVRQGGDSRRARTLYEQALELCRRIGYRHGEGVNLVNLGMLEFLVGRPAVALSSFEQAAQVFGEIGNRRGEAMVLANAASVRHSLLGDDERAEEDARRAMRQFVDVGDRAGEAQCLEVVAGVAGRRGDHGEALRLLEESLRRLAGSGNRFLEGQHLRSLALLHLEAGRADQALAVVERGEAVCAEAGLGDLAVELLSVRGAALLALGEVGAGLAAASAAVDRLGPGVEAAHLVHHRHAIAAEQAGQVEVARAAAGEAHRLLLAALEGLGEREREAALERVPRHREIVEAWRRLSPRVVEVRLPAVGAPTGRPLGEDDLRPVPWTVEHPDDDLVAPRVERRRRRLLRLVSEAAEHGAVPSMEHLAAALGVSPSTVGRDLAALRGAGHHLATRGDATRAS